MITLTVKFDPTDEVPALVQHPVRIDLVLNNTQTGSRVHVPLRPGESFSQQLRLDRCGVIELKIQG